MIEVVAFVFDLGEVVGEVPNQNRGTIMQHQKITNYTNDSQICETGKKVLVGPSVNYLLRTCSNSSCHKSGGRSQTYGNRHWRILAGMTVEQKNLRLHEVPKV